MVTAQHQPPMVNGRRIKLRYAHQGGQNPPLIVIHGKQALKVPKSYQRYLVNHFTKALRLFGTPLRVEFRQDDNPFQETKRVKPVREKPDPRRRQNKSQAQTQSASGKKARGKKVAAVPAGAGAGAKRVRRVKRDK